MPTRIRSSHTFHLTIGDIVTPGSPGPGAGHIEEPGGRNTYTFDMVAGQTVALIQQGGCEFTGGTVLRMAIEGAGVDTTLTSRDNEDDCLDVVRLTATFDGLVTMRLNEPNNVVAGSYSFEVGSSAETVEEA